MLLLLLAGCALLLGGLLLSRWVVSADPRTLMFTAKAVGIAIAVVLVGLLAVSGRIGWMLGLLPFLLPLLLRRVSLSSGATLGGFATRNKRQFSNVRTRFLNVRLDHDTGELDGDVLHGAHAGRQLSAMTMDELLDLSHELHRHERKSALLLEAYLDRRCPDWRTQFGDGATETGAEQQRSNGPTGPMTVEDAYRVLGLEPGAGEAAIRDAYHRLIASVHPDKGGSSFLAAQVNRAKEILLGGKSR